VARDQESRITETLIDLLDGDFVVIETEDVSVTTEVIKHGRAATERGDHGQWRYSIRLMPVGEDATRVAPDRYRITVEPADGGRSVSELIAEVFVEEDRSYELESRGEVTRVESLGRP